FKEAGAPDQGVALVPLSGTSAQRVADAAARLRTRLAKAGGTPSEVEAAVDAGQRRGSAPAANVVPRLPRPPRRLPSLAAPPDRAEGSEGILDDWAGCVLLTRLYAQLRTAELRHSVWFVAFARHEDGCLGAADFADSIDAAQLAKVDAAITVDAMGVSSPYAWWTGS